MLTILLWPVFTLIRVRTRGIQNYTNYTVMARIYVDSHQNKEDSELY